MRFYGVDLLDLGSGRLSWRRIRNLLSRLPREAETTREVHGAAVEWSTADHLLAHVADLLAVSNWQRGGDKKAKKPVRLPRPGDKSLARRSEMSADQMRRRLLAQRRRLGG